MDKTYQYQNILYMKRCYSKRYKAKISKKSKKCKGSTYKANGSYFVLILSRNNKTWANIGIYQWGYIKSWI